MYDAGGSNTEGISFKGTNRSFVGSDYTKESYKTKDDKTIDSLEHYERITKNMNKTTNTWEDYGFKRRIYVQNGVVYDKVIELYIPSEIYGVGK